MFDIRDGAHGEIVLIGRFDASQASKAELFMDGVSGPRVVDLQGLEYISSLGLGVLLKTQKRLMSSGSALRLVNASPHIRDVFRYAGFDRVFEIESLPSE
ncbi:MAG: STAS domain-containing protein [Acidobacteriia bacterium]|nr:STAS domain-containing protein [Terriglobia bacterium]